jgi:hypothetical protein
MDIGSATHGFGNSLENKFISELYVIKIGAREHVKKRLGCTTHQWTRDFISLI